MLKKILNEVESMVEKTEYHCLECSFRFSRNKKLNVTSCPNCAKENVEPFKNVGAEDLLKEVNSL